MLGSQLQKTPTRTSDTYLKNQSGKLVGLTLNTEEIMKKPKLEDGPYYVVNHTTKEEKKFPNFWLAWKYKCLQDSIVEGVNEVVHKEAKNSS